MKKAFFLGLLIFSLLANISVGVVILRHWWWKPGNFEAQLARECPVISKADMKKMSQILVKNGKTGDHQDQTGA